MQIGEKKDCVELAIGDLHFTLLRKNPRSLRPWINASRAPYEAHTSVVGCASEGSAYLRETALTKAGPTKHVEDPRALARGAPHRHCALP